MTELKKPIFVSAKFKEITPGVLDIIFDEYYKLRLVENSVKYDTVTIGGSKLLVCRENLLLVHVKEDVNSFGEREMKFFLKVTPDSSVIVVANRHLSSNTSKLHDAMVDRADAFTTIHVTHEYKNNLLGLTYPQSSYTAR